MAAIRSDNFPHVCLHGDFGTPMREHVAWLLEKVELGHCNRNVLTLHGLTGVGINDIRSEIISFAKCQCIGAERWKAVVIYDADLVTTAAQAALRRVMELYCTHTRFIFTTHDINSIIAPLRSRMLCVYKPRTHVSAHNLSPFEKALKKIQTSRKEASSKALLAAMSRETVSSILRNSTLFAKRGWVAPPRTGHLEMDWCAELVDQTQK